MNNLSDIQRIFLDIKGKTAEQKERASEELKAIFKKNPEISEEIFSKLQKFINSGDPNEKLGGLLALEKLSQVMQEAHIFSFVNKFLSVTFQQFQINNDSSIHKKAAEVFGKLLRLGGTKIAQVVEADVDEAIRWLKSDTTREFKRLTAILALNELLKETPYITFNRIFGSDKSLPLIFNIIRDKKLEIRKEGLEFLNECIKQICQREREIYLQQDWLLKIYLEIKSSLNNSDSDVIHGNILTLKSLLTHSREEVFAPYILDISKYILSKKETKNYYIQIAVIETIPILAHFGKGIFLLEFLDPAIKHLLVYSNQTKNPKDKALCYSTLAQIFTPLDEDFIKDYVKAVMKNILEELQQKNKPLCAETIHCLESLTIKFKKKISETVDLHLLIDYILLNGLTPASVRYLETLSKLKIPTLAEHIQCKLLLTISMILNGKIYHFSPKENLDKMIISKFQTQLIQEAGSQPDFTTVEAKGLAIQILGSFNFDSYVDSLAVFVKDVVLLYLDEMKNPGVRKAAAKAGCLLYIRKQKSVGQQMISKNLMYEILDKFLSVAISDPVVEIRQTMLASLNENFDFYLNSPNNLRKLFLCVSDTNEKVQELALIILTRLSKENPSDIIPFLKKTLYHYLLSLSYDFHQKEIEKIDLINLLGCLIKHGRDLILPHADNIAQIFLQHLKNPANSAAILTHLLDAFSQLCVHAENKVICYLDEIIPILLNAMQDKAFSKKRESATRTFVEVIKSTGFVILPYYKYPLLLENILNLMKIEMNIEMRCELLRLLGCLGAIDAFYYKKVTSKIKESSNTISRITFDEILAFGLKYPFKFMKKQVEFQTPQNRLVQELYGYYDDLILLGNFHDQKTMFLHLSNITNQNQEKNLTSPLEILAAVETPRQIEASIEELLTSPIVISLGNPDYYFTITIRTLLKVLADPSLHDHHELAIETLKLILGTLKARSANFLDLIIPVFKSTIAVWETNFKDKTENLLRLIEKIIKNCEKGFQVEFIDSILQIFQKYVTEFRLTSICLEILNTLITYKKANLRYKIEPIIKTINNIINCDDNKDHLRKALMIYKNLEELLDSYLCFIIPSLCKLITKETQLLDIEICKEIAHLFTSFASVCPSTVQYLSLMVHNLLHLLEQTQAKDFPQANQYLHSIIMNCFVGFIYKYRNNFLVYLPLVNALVSRYKIYHNEYNQCIDILLNYGNLEEMGHITEEQNFDFILANQNRPTTQTYTIINPEFLPPARKVEGENIKIEFDTSQKTLKEDWAEWMRKSSVELLRQSPNPILSPCCPIAEVYSHISHELYNIAFASCWQILNDKQKEFIIKELQRAINAVNIPINILQSILNLAEFMQHDKEGLQIDNSTLGDLAEKCMAYAKALYYREMEFETASEKTVESLIKLYSNLGQPEAASGLLVYAKRNLAIELKLSWYENLQRWEEALNDYRMMQLNNPSGGDYFVPRLRCLHALSDWEAILNNCDPIMTSNTAEDLERRKDVQFMACNAAMNMNQWEKLEKYLDIQMEFDEKNMFFAASLIQRNRLEEARILVNKTRESLDSKVSGLLLESYGRAYENVLKLQQLFEMEEIIELKSFKEKISKEIKTETQNELTREYEQRKKKLKDIWEDRLNGCERNTNVWQKILSVRSLLLNKNENMDSWLKFSRLALKTSQMQMCRRTLDSLKEEVNSDPKNEYDYPAKLVISNFECEYMMGDILEKEIVEKMMEYLLLESRQIDSVLKSKCFFKLGYWAKEKIEDLNENSIEEIFKHYSMSIQHNSEYYKVWHHYALLNFEAVEYYEAASRRDSHVIDMKERHIFAAVKGFVKSISLGGKNMFQDSLRLLNLIFKYGDNAEVSKEFRESFQSIDIIAWIEVVPQIIARSDISNQNIQNLLHQLLIHISKQHPQALIYQLTVAAKSKSHYRKAAASKILEDIKSHSSNLVSEAILISEELIRTSILLKELWFEGIEEAWKFYYNDKNTDGVIKVLTSLHEKMRNKPESLSEIAFHQNFWAEISDAEAWFQHYIKTKDEISLHQAFDIYYQIYKKIIPKIENLKIVHLENVSPKLLQTKNCEISVPGLYKPKTPIIKISGFQPKLPVLTSKQHPRKLVIYGCDSKEYHFLLKGHEDLRQDERVMQLFSLVNRLLNNKPDTEKKDLTITTYSVIPLSTNTGLIGWVQNSDTLQQLIKEYRKNNNIRNETESTLMTSMCQKYDSLPLANKVEIFRHVLENTKGEDLQKVLWLKSPNSEIWLERRTNYTRSLATMSMVGYILGLGDRHPSNIMLQRFSGKIVHIDFGDCWEVAMKREKFPERVPFRLTRMLSKAMEACGIEGNYRNTCELVMKVLRDNKESLNAVLEAFVYDPLLNWRLLTISAENDIHTNKVSNNLQQNVNEKVTHSFIGNRVGTSFAKMGALTGVKNVLEEKFNKEQKEPSPKRKETGREKELQQHYADEGQEKPTAVLNQKALAVTDRIKKKLVGKDFRENEALKVVEQVNKLIKQATSHENICQAYMGWCPFW